jgi:branched-chain amino acid transport system permease protein
LAYEILSAIINGLVLSSTYMFAGVGLTLVFGVLGIYNFAHGELIMLGAYIVWLIFTALELPFILAIAVAAIVIGTLGIGIERAFFRPTRTEPFLGFMLSIGLVYILQVFATIVFTNVGKSVTPISFAMVKIGTLNVTLERLLIIPISFLVLLAVWIFLERTKYGRAVRATSQDPRAAALQGMNVSKMSMMVMFISGALAGLAGALVGQFTAVTPVLGSSVIMNAFVVVIIGGSGSIGGTVVASLIFGMMTSFVSSFISPQVAVVSGALLMALILVIRPQGLFGHE